MSVGGVAAREGGVHASHACFWSPQRPEGHWPESDRCNQVGRARHDLLPPTAFAPSWADAPFTSSKEMATSLGMKSCIIARAAEAQRHDGAAAARISTVTVRIPAHCAHIPTHPNCSLTSSLSSPRVTPQTYIPAACPAAPWQPRPLRPSPPMVTAVRPDCLRRHHCRCSRPGCQGSPGPLYRRCLKYCQCMIVSCLAAGARAWARRVG